MPRGTENIPYNSTKQPKINSKFNNIYSHPSKSAGPGTSPAKADHTNICPLLIITQASTAADGKDEQRKNRHYAAVVDYFCQVFL